MKQTIGLKRNIIDKFYTNKTSVELCCSLITLSIKEIISDSVNLIVFDIILELELVVPLALHFATYQ